MSTWTFGHLADPQIGMGPDPIALEKKRLVSAVRKIDRTKPEVVLLSGDLTHSRAPDQYVSLEVALSECEAPLRLIPGNHDLIGPNDREGLEFFRERFGPDRYAFTARDLRFVCLNSMLLDPDVITDRELRDESETQWEWLDKELSESGGRCVLHMHTPPFTETPDEPDSYFNLPTSVRKRLLERIQARSVRWLVAGHTHTTTELQYGPCTIYTTSGTARALDDRGTGFRIFRVSGDELSTEFVTVGGG